MTVHSSSDLSGGKINEQNIVFVFYSHVSTVFRHKKKSEMTYDTKIAFVRQILLTHYMTF